MENHLVIPNQNYTRSLIFCIWQTNGNPSHSREIILPKGVIDLIFNFSNSGIKQVRNEGETMELPRCFINGYNTNPVLLSIPGHQSFFGIRFNPVAIRLLFGITPGELLNLSLDLTLIDKSMDSLWHSMAALNKFSDRVDSFVTWLSYRELHTNTSEETLKDFLYSSQVSDISVVSLAENLRISRRHLSRKLKVLTGMNTEEILLYRKYLYALALMHKTKSSLTEIAHACYFYDQSHFIRTFRLFTNMAPREYLTSKSDLPGHLFH